MARTRMVSAMALAALVGTGLGIHLGRAAIGAIDPFYFTEPRGIESYAELVPAASLSRPWSAEVELAGADEDWRAGCIGCGPDKGTLEIGPDEPSGFLFLAAER